VSDYGGESDAVKAAETEVVLTRTAAAGMQAGDDTALACALSRCRRSIRSLKEQRQAGRSQSTPCATHRTVRSPEVPRDRSMPGAYRHQAQRLGDRLR
jgi:hypothetical protein